MLAGEFARRARAFGAPILHVRRDSIGVGAGALAFTPDDIAGAGADRPFRRFQQTAGSGERALVRGEGFNRVAREGHALSFRLRVLDGVIALGVGESEMGRGSVGRGFVAGAELVWIGGDWPKSAFPLQTGGLRKPDIRTGSTSVAAALARYPLHSAQGFPTRSLGAVVYAATRTGRVPAKLTVEPIRPRMVTPILESQVFSELPSIRKGTICTPNDEHPLPPVWARQSFRMVSVI